MLPPGYDKYISSPARWKAHAVYPYGKKYHLYDSKSPVGKDLSYGPQLEVGTDLLRGPQLKQYFHLKMA